MKFPFFLLSLLANVKKKQFVSPLIIYQLWHASLPHKPSFHWQQQGKTQKTRLIFNINDKHTPSCAHLDFHSFHPRRVVENNDNNHFSYFSHQNYTQSSSNHGNINISRQWQQRNEEQNFWCERDTKTGTLSQKMRKAEILKLEKRQFSFLSHQAAPQVPPTCDECDVSKSDSEVSNYYRTHLVMFL